MICSMGLLEFEGRDGDLSRSYKEGIHGNSIEGLDTKQVNACWTEDLVDCLPSKPLLKGR
jgi:hypothetical protein